MTNERISLDQAYDNADVIAQILDLRDDAAELADDVRAKQDALVSGQNIKTINGESVLGSGNLAIDVTVEVDDALSATSENPVQNKVITLALNGKQPTGDYATNTALSQGLAGKQDALSTAQMNAANSGITSAKVSTYDGYASQISGKQDALVSGTNIKTINNESILGSGNISIQGGGITVDSALSATSENPVQNKVITLALNGKQPTGDYATNTALTQGLAGKQDALSTAQMNAANSGITSAKVSTYDGYASTIAGKQDALSTAQLNAANSGITSAKVSAYDGYASQIAGKQGAIQTASVTVPAAGGTVSVTGMTASAVVFVSPDPSSFDVYAEAECRCTAQASGSLTFAVGTTASAAMSVNVAWFV